MSKTLNRWQRMGLGAKLALSNLLLVATVMTLGVLSITYAVSLTMQLRATQEVSDKTKMLVEMIASSERDLRKRSQDLSNPFSTCRIYYCLRNWNFHWKNNIRIPITIRKIRFRRTN